MQLRPKCQHFANFTSLDLEGVDLWSNNFNENVGTVPLSAFQILLFYSCGSWVLCVRYFLLSHSRVYDSRGSFQCTCYRKRCRTFWLYYLHIQPGVVLLAFQVPYVCRAFRRCQYSWVALNWTPLALFLMRACNSFGCCCSSSGVYDRAIAAAVFRDENWPRFKALAWRLHHALHRETVEKTDALSVAIHCRGLRYTAKTVTSGIEGVIRSRDLKRNASSRTI